MPSPRYFILTAIRAESRAIAKAFGVRGPRGRQPVDLPGGRAGIELYTVGIGAVRMPDLSGRAVAGIIMAGLAGALDPRLNIGDVVVDQSCTWRASRVTIPRVWFHGVDHPVITPQEKAELFGKTGASIVEMENEVVKRAAKAYNVPFLGVRAVSDTATESIDPAVLDFIDPFGRPRLGAIINTVARRPSLIKHMRQLSRSSNVALEALAAAVKGIVTPADSA